MLVFSRQRDQSVMVGNVRVLVVDVKGERVRLGFEAPPSIPIHREEIYEEIKQERKKNADQSLDAFLVYLSDQMVALPFECDLSLQNDLFVLNQSGSLAKASQLLIDRMRKEKKMLISSNLVLNNDGSVVKRMKFINRPSD